MGGFKSQALTCISYYAGEEVNGTDKVFSHVCSWLREKTSIRSFKFIDLQILSLH
jgi:hypothetical protein